MSTQRRRVLENAETGVPIDKISNGVYIEGLNGKAYTVDNWNGGTDANSVIVASGKVKFRMALMQSTVGLPIGYVFNNFEDFVTAISGETKAEADYNGAGNTAKILKLEPSTSYAAGYCNAFTFPDGKTKGYLPSLGQLHLAYKNKAAVNAAFTACGATEMTPNNYGYYWSSTFWGIEDSNGYRCFWHHAWSKDYVGYGFGINMGLTVHPFADIS